MVAAGILASRVMGFVRLRVIGNFFGTSAVADAFFTAFRIPNVMQNLLGEGVLSASFIPVHAKLLAAGRREEAGRVAGAVLGLLTVTAAVVSLAGILLADPLTSLVAPGFVGAKRDLTVQLMRIMTPGIGLLVLSAWCLGVLNAHRKFFLSYVAPVIWNVMQIGALVGAAWFILDPPLAVADASPSQLEQLAVALAFGALAGGLAQFLVQLPAVLRLEPDLRPSLRRDLPGVRQVLRAAGPVVAGRGVVQLATYVDLLLASLLATGAAALLTYSQQLYLLPVSLFGMSVAAAELPDLSAMDHGDVRRVATRIDDGLARIAFWVVGSMVVYIVVGDLLVGTLFRTGAFDADVQTAVWLVLGTFSLGLVATTSSRLLQSLLYGVGDTRTPAITSVIRVGVSIVVGGLLMLQFDRFGIVDGAVTLLDPGSLPTFRPVDPTLRGQAVDQQLRLGAVGLAVGAGIGAWVEWRRLRRVIADHMGVRARIAGRSRGRLLLPAVAAVAAGLAARVLVRGWPVAIAGVVATGVVGLVYVATAFRTGVGEVDAVVGSLAPRLGPVGRVLLLWRASLRRNRPRD
nr:murein biosynthesis integral membrane protein MurJ [Salsipaludibacter albus]